MKRCPICKRTYSDESLSFCLEDGSLLSASLDPQATHHFPGSRDTDLPPTEIMYPELNSADVNSLSPTRQVGEVTPELPTITGTIPVENAQIAQTSPAVKDTVVDLAIDIGNHRTLIYRKGYNIVSEPSIVAIDKLTNTVKAVGNDAEDFNAASNITIDYPMKDGKVADCYLAERMLQHFIHKACGGETSVSPRVVIAISSVLTNVERRAFTDAAYGAKAAKVYLVDRIICAAIGAGLPIKEPHGNMIIHIGRSVSEIIVMFHGKRASFNAVSVAGDIMDKEITQYIKRKYYLLISEQMAEQVKIKLGSAFPLDEPLLMEVKGHSLIEGIPKTITITDEEIREALADPVTAIVHGVLGALERMPPELSADIVERGIVLTGGGALLKNLDRRLSIETGLPVSLAEDPLSSVVLGTGKMLSDFNLLKRMKWDDT